MLGRHGIATSVSNDLIYEDRISPTPSIDLSRINNSMFEPYEVSIYHKKRKTYIDVLNESKIEH